MNHGHVTPNPEGIKARCGGPALCSICAREAALEYAKQLEIEKAVIEAQRKVIEQQRQELAQLRQELGEQEYFL